MFRMKLTSYISFNQKKKAAIIVFLVGIPVFLFLQRQYSDIRPEMLRDLIISLGAYGPLALVLFSIFRPLLLFPITLVYLALGLAYGPFWGGVLAVMSAAISAMVAHGLADHAGIGFLPVKWQEKVMTAKKKMETNGFRNVLLIRFIPMISYDLVSYAGGLAKVNRLSYLAGTVVGITPRIFAYTFVGNNVVNIGESSFWIALALLLLIFLLPVYICRRSCFREF